MSIILTTGLRWGLLLGLALVGWGLVFNLSKLKINSWWGAVFYVLLPIAVMAAQLSVPERFGYGSGVGIGGMPATIRGRRK